MQLSRLEKDLIHHSLLQSIDTLNKCEVRNRPLLKETFDTAIKARRDLITKVMAG